MVPLSQIVRGGGGGGGATSSDGSRNEVLASQESDTPRHDDSERYSRQMYVLGARAHALVRTSNVIVDGPLKSGLLFECAKNLALSGVGTITILTDNAGEEEENDQIHKLHSIYHNEKLDDLGNAYTRAAIGETGYDDILQYLQRLNPSLSVSTISRSAFATKCATRASLERTLGVTPATTVYLCIDRPESTQLTTNSLCRTLQIPFVSTETAGLYGRIFCDFGPDFVVLDPDGGTPRQTLLDRVEVISNNFTTTSDDLTNTLDLMIFCVEESTHEVSRGDSFQFYWKQGYEHQHSDPIIGKVLEVKSPTQLAIRIQLNDEGRSNKSLIFHKLAQQIHHSANYFSKLKQPISVPFLSMKDALEAAKKSASRGNNEPMQLFAIADLEKSSDIARRNALMKRYSFS